MILVLKGKSNMRYLMIRNNNMLIYLYKYVKSYINSGNKLYNSDNNDKHTKANYIHYRER